MITFLVQYYYPGPRSMFNYKQVKARDLLGSCASDIDVVLDWWFYVDTYLTDSENGIPSTFQYVHLFFTIMGTLSWFSLASDGRAVDWFIIRPLQLLECLFFTCGRCCGCGKAGKPSSFRSITGSTSSNNKKVLPVRELWEENKSEDYWSLNSVQISTGFLLFCGIFLEDIPQIIMSFWVQKFKAAEGADTTGGLMVANLLTSIYNAVIKLADAYDQREDVVTVGAS